MDCVLQEEGVSDSKTGFVSCVLGSERGEWAACCWVSAEPGGEFLVPLASCPRESGCPLPVLVEGARGTTRSGGERVHTEGSKPRMLDEQVCADGGVIQSGRAGPAQDPIPGFGPPASGSEGRGPTRAEDSVEPPALGHQGLWVLKSPCQDLESRTDLHGVTMTLPVPRPVQARLLVPRPGCSSYPQQRA